MALPKLNVLPNFELTIPSNGKKVRYRPYLVKEEKMLLLAAESKDPKTILQAMTDTIKDCVDGDIDVDKLATFDIEYMFVQIRAKSVGEVIKLKLKCDNEIDGEVCGFENEVNFKVDSIAVDVPKVDKIIKLTDDISVELKWPSYKDLSNTDLAEGEITTEAMFKLVAKSIAAVLTPEERFDLKDSTEKEIVDFIESLSSEQFGKISSFLGNIPKMKAQINYTCEKCGKQHEIKLEGAADFF